MITINLLPWRETQYAVIRRYFFYCLITGIVFICLLAIISQRILTGAIANQTARNDYIQTKINHYDADIKKINSIKTEKNSYLQKITSIEDLRLRQSSSTYWFETVVKVMPPGVYLLSLQKTPNRINLTGLAESANHVATLMHNLENSKWLQDPRLTTLTTITGQGVFTRQFIITSKVIISSSLPQENK